VTVTPKVKLKKMGALELLCALWAPMTRSGAML